MAAYDLTCHAPGNVAPGDTVFTAVSPRGVVVYDGRGAAGVLPAEVYSAAVLLDGVEVEGASVEVGPAGVRVVLPRGGITVPARARLTVVAPDGASGSDISISFKGDDGVASENGYDVAGYSQAPDDPDSGGTVLTAVAVRDFRVSELRAVFPDAAGPVLVVVTHVPLAGPPVTAFGVVRPSSTHDRCVLDRGLDVKAGDRLVSGVYGPGSTTGPVALTLLGRRDALTSSYPAYIDLTLQALPEIELAGNVFGHYTAALEMLRAPVVTEMLGRVIGPVRAAFTNRLLTTAYDLAGTATGSSPGAFALDAVPVAYEIEGRVTGASPGSLAVEVTRVAYDLEGIPRGTYPAGIVFSIQPVEILLEGTLFVSDPPYGVVPGMDAVGPVVEEETPGGNAFDNEDETLPDPPLDESTPPEGEIPAMSGDAAASDGSSPGMNAA